MKSLTAAYEKDKLEFIKNPMVAEFLGLASNMDFTESRLESAILTHLQKFIMEMLCKPLHNNSYANKFIMQSDLN